ncbi:hypothetical protein EO087_03810 [Dyella sp. M7H15-1]|uniref:hypothetical protein n=1 Tax=Dyella sp. M7H15-1 TaxID=2501295 RepID=UPI001004DB5F|nr:hypothetical protein [Dyella sp. M7H15-1]QAU23220.1 hypothetical protein EO087_03810 [Dyella sp. M7H15-1]
MGSPPQSGRGKWYRFTLAELATKAFGAAGKAEISRAQRAQDVLINLGVLRPTKQVRRARTDVGAVRSDPGVRHVDWERVAQLMGTLALYENDRTWRIKQERKHVAAMRGNAPLGPRDPAERVELTPEEIAAVEAGLTDSS